MRCDTYDSDITTRPLSTAAMVKCCFSVFSIPVAASLVVALVGLAIISL